MPHGHPLDRGLDMTVRQALFREVGMPSGCPMNIYIDRVD